jgi:threonine dehydratase
MSLAISFQDVEAAAQRVSELAHRTPVLTSRQFDELVGAHVFFKAENMQRVGAFKFRGALNALLQFSPKQRADGVVTFSSGNHAQAVALAAKLLGIPSVIVMPKDAPASKLAATRGYQQNCAGSQVILYDRFTEDREAIVAKLAAERGMTIVPPYDHAHVMAGNGTAAFELLQETGPLDYLFVCTGGGGLLSGSATAASKLAPDCRVYGVEPEAGNDAQQSLRAGRIIHISTPVTIADGAQTQHLGNLTFPVIQKLVADILTVTDAQVCL